MANEKRLIDANAWKSFYEDMKNILDRFYTHDAGYEDALDNVDDWMDAPPTVDAVEVVHGRWVEDTATDMIACTECGHAWNTIDNCTETFNYCPNCGAKMDGDGNG